MAEPCLFCRIASGEIPAKLVAEGATCIAFRDVNPQAPVHVLVIPTEHVESLNETSDPQFLGDLLVAAREVARQQRVDVRGYRVVINTKAESGQTVPHIHVHLLGGRAMHWPPG